MTGRYRLALYVVLESLLGLAWVTAKRAELSKGSKSTLARLRLVR